MDTASQSQIDILIRRVRTYLRETGETRKGLCLRAGLSDGTLKRVFEPDWNPTAETLRALETVLNAVVAEVAA